MKVLREGALLILCIVCVPGVNAESMACGTHVISDSERMPPTQKEILRKCGKPSAQGLSDWVYRKQGDAVYRLRFDSDGKLKSIKYDIKR